MEPTKKELDQIREKLLAQKSELTIRVDRIHEHARNPLDSDSAEQAAQLGNVAVVAALESEAVEELAEIDAALQRVSAGIYGSCISCGDYINKKRLEARPASTECVACAESKKPN